MQLYQYLILIIQKKKETKNKKDTFKEKKNAIGAIFLSEKKKFQDIGMFDENYFFYWEDVDLSKRINKSEYKIFLNSNSQAIHANSRSTKLNLNSEFIRSSNFKFGEYYFQYKYDKLKLIKVIREPINNLIMILFFLLVFKFKKALYKFFQLVGIFVFFKFIFFKKLK
jgi:GT2 family glycosyltransferase